MSAICALYRWDGVPVPAALPQQLLTALSEYGPGASCWAPETAERPVALGCIPWHVTPEDAHYRGPVRSEADDVVLVADARIDNRDELASRLELTRSDLSQLSDAALVLAAWRKWKQDCPRFLIGDFAFVLWDGRARELFCARDAMATACCSTTSLQMAWNWRLARTR